MVAGILHTKIKPTVSIYVYIVVIIFTLFLPHCFLLNLLEHFVSGTKAISFLNGTAFVAVGSTTQKNN